MLLNFDAYIGYSYFWLITVCIFRKTTRREFGAAEDEILNFEIYPLEILKREHRRLDQW